MPTTEEHRNAKATAIAEVLTAHAQAQVLLATKLHKATRKMPRIKSKRTNYVARLAAKRIAATLRVEMLINTMNNSAQLGVIISQPIPKFPLGTRPAMINETNTEEIILTNAKATPFNNADNQGSKQ